MIVFRIYNDRSMSFQWQCLARVAPSFSELIFTNLWMWPPILGYVIQVWQCKLVGWQLNWFPVLELVCFFPLLLQFYYDSSGRLDLALRTRIVMNFKTDTSFCGPLVACCWVSCKKHLLRYGLTNVLLMVSHSGYFRWLDPDQHQRNFVTSEALL